MKSLYKAVENTKEKNEELDQQLGDTSRGYETLTRKLLQKEEEKSDAESQVSMLEEALLENQFAIKALNEDKNSLKSLVDKCRNDQTNMLRKQKIDHEKQIDALSSKQNDMSLIMEESRVHYEDSLEAVQQKLIDIYKAKGVADERCGALQEQLGVQDESMRKLAGDSKAVQAQYEARLEAADTSIDSLMRTLEATIAERDRGTQQLFAEKENCQNQIQAAKQKNIANNERYIEVFSNIQGIVQSLTHEATAGRNRTKELVSQVNLFNKKLSLIDGANTTSVKALKEELTEVYKTLRHKKHSYFESMDNDKVEKKQLQIAKDEEVGRALMLEEQLSRLEHEAAGYLKKVTQLEKDSAYQAKRQTLLVDKLKAEKQQLDDKLVLGGKVQNELQGKLNGLLTETQQQQAIIDGMQMKQNVTDKDKETKVGQLTSQLRKEHEEKDIEGKRAARLTHQINQLLTEMDELKATLNSAYTMNEKLKRENQELAQKVTYRMRLYAPTVYECMYAPTV